MCGRYQVAREFSEIRLAFEARLGVMDSELDLSGNISASYGETSRAPLITGEGGERRLSSGRFWYVPPFWQRPLKALPTSFNARVERVLGSRFWRSGAETRRCLVPALSWFERDTRSRHYQFSPVSEEYRANESCLFALAGLWADSEDDDGTPIRSFAILTREANGDAAQIHPRMPLIVHPHLYDEWLFTQRNTPQLLQRTLERTLEIPLAIVEEDARKGRAKSSLTGQLDWLSRIR